MSATFISDRNGIANRHGVGVDNMMWSTDYPHHGNDWPYSRKAIADTMGDLPADERHKIVAGNAVRIFNLGRGGDMDIDDLVLVSVDDHVVEPPGMWDGHLPAKYADEAPKLVTKDGGNDVWSFRGQELPNIGLNAVAGRPPAEYGIDPTVVRRHAPRLLRHPRAHRAT